MRNTEEVQLAIFLGILIGVLARTFVAWWNVHNGNVDVTFDWRYAATAAVAFFTALATAQALLESYVPIVTDNLIVAFVFALIWAYMLNEGANRAADKGRH